MKILSKVEKSAHKGSTLPNPDSSWRGMIFIKFGASGERDKVYLCKKDENDQYFWTNIDAAFVEEIY